jgi:hypothetical protein
MAGKHVEWRVLPEHPSFEINRLGDLRQTKNQLPMDPGFKAKFYYGLRQTGDSNKIKRDLIRTAFPELR